MGACVPTQTGVPGQHCSNQAVVLATLALQPPAAQPCILACVQSLVIHGTQASPSGLAGTVPVRY